MLSVGLVETATIRSDVQIDRDSPLLCPLSKYPIPGRIVLIPYRLNPDSIRYMQEISSQILAADDTFVVVALPHSLGGSVLSCFVGAIICLCISASSPWCKSGFVGGKFWGIHRVCS